MAELVEVGDAEFDAAVMASALPVLVDCWAPWCKPCAGMAPALEEFARRHAGRIAVAKVDVDANTGVAKAHGVRSLPTLLLVRDGQVLGKRVGVLTAQQMAEWAEGLLGGPAGAG